MKSKCHDDNEDETSSLSSLDRIGYTYSHASIPNVCDILTDNRPMVDQQPTIPRQRTTTTTTNNKHGQIKKSSYHLIVHFDINETVLIGDEAGGDSFQDVIHKMLAKSAFVQIPKTNDGVIRTKKDLEDTSQVEPTHWWDGSKIRTIKDEIDGNDQASRLPPPLYTGWTWPKDCCPYYRTRCKRRAKTFVEHDGAIYRPIYDVLDRTLRQQQQQHTHHVFEHILPALFETLIVLAERQANDDHIMDQHTIVFRTMGTDLPILAKAMSLFAQGKHPLYPDFYHPEYILPETHLYQGRWVSRHDNGSNTTARHGATRDDDYVYQLSRNNQVVALGDEELLDLLHGNTSSKVFGIQDDYPFWNANDCHPWAGKPVWSVLPVTKDDDVLLSGGGDDDNNNHAYTYYHHLLFDDNIHNLVNDSIASVRKQQQPIDAECPDDDLPVASTTVSTRPMSFRTLSGQEIQEEQGRSLIRVPTIEPVLNRQWFVEQIDRATATFFQRQQETCCKR